MFFTLRPLLGHVLHVLIDVIESALDHFLEWALHVSKRQVDFIVFWGSLVTALYLFWHLSRKAYHNAQHEYATVQANWREKSGSTKIAAWMLIIFMVIAFDKALFLFS